MLALPNRFAISWGMNSKSTRMVEITKRVFEAHLARLTTSEYRSFAKWKRAFPKSKAVFERGQLLTVT